MAGRRQQSAGRKTDSSTSNDNGNNTNTTNGGNAMSALEELTLDQILEIEAGGREKGIYKEDLIEFAQSGKMGQPYPFTGKKAQSVKTGFVSAREAVEKDESVDDETKEAVKNTEVRVRNDAVYLIRRDLVKAAKAGAKS